MAHNFHHEETFVQLSMKDFPALGIKTLDERKKLFALIGRVKGGGSPASSSPFASLSGATVSTRYPPQSAISQIKQEPPRRASLPEGNSLVRKTHKQVGQGRSSVPGSGLKHLQKVAEEEAELDEDEDLPLPEDKEPPRQPPVLSKRG